MHMLIGLVLGCGLLYFWLVGHWFARVLVFLPLAFLLGFIGIGIAYGQHPSAGVFFAVWGVAGAWPVSSIPTWYWRRRMRVLTLAERRSPLLPG